MNDILEFIDDLKELQTLYDNGELRNIDFVTKIKSYEDKVTAFEDAMDAQYNLFFKDTPFKYDPIREV